MQLRHLRDGDNFVYEGVFIERADFQAGLL